MSPHTVLILEDDHELSTLLRTAVELFGFTPLCCATLAEAQEALRSTVPSAAIIDGTLPDGHGAQLVPLLRALAPGCVIILSSGAGVSGFEHITDAFLLEKPFRITELHTLLSAIASRPS